MSNNSFHLNKELQNHSGFQKFLTPVVLLGLILLLGISLRFYDLGAESYWIDELQNLIDGQRSIVQIVAPGRFDQPPAYHVPFHFWMEIFGTNEVGTRSFSVLAGIGSIVLIYLIGRELFGKEVGLLGAFFMAISEFQIRYSQLAKFFTFYELTTLLSFFFFILALRSKRIIHFALYVLATILMVYSHTYGIFIIVVQNLFIILQLKKYRKLVIIWLICQSLFLIVFVPYFYPLLFSEGSLENTIQSNAGNLPIPTFFDPLRTVYHFVFGPRLDRSWGSVLANYAVAGLVFMAGTWIYIIRQARKDWVDTARRVISTLQKEPDINGKLLLACCWLLCPILLPFIASYVFMPLYKDYYMINAAPALYLLLGFGLFSIRKLVPLIISLAVYAIMILPSLGYYYATDIQEQWREVATYVEENSRQDEVIVFAPDMGTIGIQQRSFYWYYRGNSQGCGLSSRLINPVAISEALMQCVSKHNRFWVIIPDYPNETSDDPFRSFFLDPNQKTMNLIKEHQFVDISVYLFELTK